MIHFLVYISWHCEVRGVWKRFMYHLILFSVLGIWALKDIANYKIMKYVWRPSNSHSVFVKNIVYWVPRRFQGVKRHELTSSRIPYNGEKQEILMVSSSIKVPHITAGAARKTETAKSYSEYHRFLPMFPWTCLQVTCYNIKWREERGGKLFMSENLLESLYCLPLIFPLASALDLRLSGISM